MSVDGVQVTTGQPYDPAKGGFIIGRRDRSTVFGFRRDANTVARFRFGTLQRSYAHEVGTERAVGTIGVYFYAEAIPAGRSATGVH